MLLISDTSIRRYLLSKYEPVAVSIGLNIPYYLFIKELLATGLPFRSRLHDSRRKNLFRLSLFQPSLLSRGKVVNSIRSIMKRHTEIGQVKWHSTFPEYIIGLAIIGALDDRKILYIGISRYICDLLIVLSEPSTLVNCLLLSPEPFFAQEFECKYYVCIAIEAKHLSND